MEHFAQKVREKEIDDFGAQKTNFWIPNHHFTALCGQVRVFNANQWCTGASPRATGSMSAHTFLLVPAFSPLVKRKILVHSPFSLSDGHRLVLVALMIPERIIATPLKVSIFVFLPNPHRRSSYGSIRWGKKSHTTTLSTQGMLHELSCFGAC